jgi:uncharacterized membrane protein
MTQLVLGLVLFLGIHSISILAPGWRDSMVNRLGALGWKGLYSVASLLAFVLLVHGYSLARQEPVVVYQPPTWTRHLAMLLMLPVFPLLLSAYLPGRIKAAVKHPMLTATKTWALAHLLANGMLADVLLFGGFLAWAVMDRISVGKRPVREVRAAAPRKFNDLIAIVGGLLIYGLFVGWAHLHLIGVPLMP